MFELCVLTSFFSSHLTFFCYILTLDLITWKRLKIAKLEFWLRKSDHPDLYCGITFKVLWNYIQILLKDRKSKQGHKQWLLTWFHLGLCSFAPTHLTRCHIREVGCQLSSCMWPPSSQGEAQKIDKLMEAFAERYCECNPGIISTGKPSLPTPPRHIPVTLASPPSSIMLYNDNTSDPPRLTPH